MFRNSFYTLRGLFLAALLWMAGSDALAGPDGAGHQMLHQRVQQAIRQGTTFPVTDLFTPASGPLHREILEAETLLQPRTDAISRLFVSRPAAFALPFTGSNGTTYLLQLMQSSPVSNALTAGTIDAGGRHAADYTPGLHYQGSVAGVENSLAAVSIFANGDVMVLFATDEGNFVVGKLEDASGRYIFYNDKDMRYHPEMRCGVEDETTPLEGSGNKTTAALMCNKVKIYWEVSYNVFTSKSSNLTTTQNYVTGLFNQMQTLYTNDNIAVELKSLYIWTTQDDYPTSGSSPALDKFKGYWNRMGNSFDGDLAHLLTRDNNGNGGGNGGLAYVNALCNRGIAYAYSDIYGNYSNVPAYSWDAMVITHETGHNLGSRHTHSCSWMTGPGNTCGAIDNCTTLETSGACPSCSSTFLNSQPTSAWKGTIMSYCHLVARGISLANGFGPLPGAFIRDRVSSSTCLSSIINAELVTTPICNGSGAINVTFPANNRGTAPFIYLWNTAAQTQNLTNLTNPGVYSVEIADSNNCIAAFSTELKAGPFGGNTTSVPVIMPICCQPTGLTVPLEATPASFSTGCENVYWLRSSVPLSTPAEIRNYFDTTAASNIILPSNSASVNGTTGARLSVNVPASCTGPVTEYYIPVVARLPRTADSLVVVSGVPTPVTGSGNVVIGTSVSLPSQLGQVTACNALDTPSAQSLTVTVAGYTGRPQYMRMIIEDNANRVLYQRFGAGGNGTYNIPVSVFNDSLLRALVITVVDYNCNTVNSTTTCTTSTAVVTATRRVVWNALPLRAAPACAAGNGVRLDFAPNGCTPLSVISGTLDKGQTTLSPNPATQTASLSFRLLQAGAVQMKVTNLAGQTVFVRDAVLAAGSHTQQLDLRSWARGMYFVTLSSGKEKAESMKLVVE